MQNKICSLLLQAIRGCFATPMTRLNLIVKRIAVGGVIVGGACLYMVSYAQAIHGSYVQAGSFTKKANAYKFKKRLQSQTTYPVSVSHKSTLYVVRVGPIPTVTEEQEVALMISSQPHRVLPKETEVIPALVSAPVDAVRHAPLFGGLFHKQQAATTQEFQPVKTHPVAVKHARHRARQPQQVVPVSQEQQHASVFAALSPTHWFADDAAPAVHHDVYDSKMGAVAPVARPFIPFLSGEASYTWPVIEGFHFNVKSLSDISSTTETKGWGGRVAVGMLRAYNDLFSYTGEIGWGYYGRSNLTPQFQLVPGASTAPDGTILIPPANTMTLSIEEYGFDVLAGVLYTQPKYDLYFKAGALLMNANMHLAMNPHEILRGSSSANSFIPDSIISVNMTLPAVMPEIKLGGAYHLSNNWVANVAWMHAFSGTFGQSAPNISFSPSTQIGSSEWNLFSPTLNSVMFGLEYRFA